MNNVNVLPLLYFRRCNSAVVNLPMYFRRCHSAVSIPTAVLLPLQSCRCNYPRLKLMLMFFRRCIAGAPNKKNKKNSEHIPSTSHHPHYVCYVLHYIRNSDTSHTTKIEANSRLARAACLTFQNVVKISHSVTFRNLAFYYCKIQFRFPLNMWLQPSNLCIMHPLTTEYLE